MSEIKKETLEEAKQRAKNYMRLKGALEPKQETLEEAAKKFWDKLSFDDAFEAGAKWQQIQDKDSYLNGYVDVSRAQAKLMYSEQDLISFYNFIENHRLRKYGDVWKRITNDPKDKPLNFESVDDQYIIDWFEQFKK